MANPNLTIMLAVYASNNKGADVTSQVTSLTASGNDDVTANNASFGDPDPGSTKYFIVWYTSPSVNNGNPVGLACAEGQTIDLIPTSPPSYYFATSAQPSLGQSAISTISVTRAVYGTPNNGFDVTAICQAIVNQGGIVAGQSSAPAQIAIANETFGGDPDYGNTKYFAMEYSVNGTATFVGGQEGQTLSVGF
ncbi:SUEL-type lectin domain-containing protein [Sphingomonas sp. LB-2]|uniref:SUEL-type lectin domain-containing protein n=1 Tax=Sphingomonas caeni TaxID=2984949 RepID=UPI002231AB9A|nr:SUEL-type lectin domain-containing protein [Sphingomonas caeni]MCW3847631.1 SUEL-type lectin domain-containing protein [Sphingomonas caeni]